MGRCEGLGSRGAESGEGVVVSAALMLMVGCSTSPSAGLLLRVLLLAKLAAAHPEPSTSSVAPFPSLAAHRGNSCCLQHLLSSEDYYYVFNAFSSRWVNDGNNGVRIRNFGSGERGAKGKTWSLEVSSRLCANEKPSSFK